MDAPKQKTTLTSKNSKLTHGQLIIVHLFHIIFVGGLFLYVGINKNKSPKWIYYALFVVALMVLYVHVNTEIAQGGADPISWFHILFVAPLLLYIGYNGQQTPYAGYMFLLFAAFAAIGYHSYAMYEHS